LADCNRPRKLALLRGCHHQIELMKKGRAAQAAALSVFNDEIR